MPSRASLRLAYAFRYTSSYFSERQSRSMKDVVDGAPLAVHADRHLVSLQHVSESLGRELRSLVGVEDFRPTVSAQGIGQCLDAEVHRHAVRQPPRQHG